MDGNDAQRDLTTPSGNNTGRLELSFSVDGNGRTFIDHQYASNPFHICRAHYLDADLPEMATLYIQSCAGGIYRDDRHEICITANPGANVHLTTQASTIVHGMVQGEAHQTTRILVRKNAFVEYLPDPMILFPIAHLTSSIELRMEEDAQIVLGDAFLSHDPEQREEPFGFLANELRMIDGMGHLIALDRFRVEGDEIANGKSGAMGRHNAHGMLIAVVRQPIIANLKSSLVDVLSTVDGIYAGVSILPQGTGVWVRFTTIDGSSLSHAMLSAWKTTRLAISGHIPDNRRK